MSEPSASDTYQAEVAARERLMAQSDPTFPELTDGERLTLLAKVFRSVLTPDGSGRPLSEYVSDLGVPINELLGSALLLSTEFYSRSTLEHLMALLWNRRPPRVSVRGENG